MTGRGGTAVPPLASPGRPNSPHPHWPEKSILTDDKKRHSKPESRRSRHMSITFPRMFAIGGVPVTNIKEGLKSLSRTSDPGSFVGLRSVFPTLIHGSHAFEVASSLEVDDELPDGHHPNIAPMQGPTMGSFAERRTCSGHFRLCRPSGQGSAPYPRTRLSLQARRSRSELSGHNARGGAQGCAFGILRPVKDRLRLSLRLPSPPAWR